MADDRQPRSLVDEIKTAEFVVPTKRDLDEELVLPTVSSLPGAGQEARALVAAALQELEATAGDDSRKGRIHLSLGLIIEQRLGDVRRAVSHYLEAYRLAPTNLAVVRSLRRVFWTRQNWSMVLKLLDDELALTANPGQAARLQLQRGRIFESWLANTEAAVEAYREALKHDPGNRQALYRLRQIFWRWKDQAALLEICKQTAAATQDRRHRALLFGEIARIQEQHLDQVEGAIETYAAAFAEDPGNVAVAVSLKRLYHQHGRWGDLVDVLLTEGELAASDRQRVQALVTAARLCRDPMGQQERALELLTRARELLPQDAPLLQEMADLLQEVGRYKELALVFRARIKCLTDEWERVAAHYQLGKVLEERLNEEEEALFHYRRAVALDPTYVPALQAMGKLCQRRGEWAELVAISSSEAEVIQDAEARASRLCGLAELCETQLADRAQAIDFHRRALAGLSNYLPAVHALERLYTEEGDWAALVDLLESQLELDPDRGRLLERLGRLCEERLEDYDRAVGFYNRALEILPTDLALMRSLQRLRRRAGRWDQVIEVLDQEIYHTDDEPLRVALMHKAAEICEGKLDDLEQAVERYGEILARVADHAPTLKSLGRIYFRQGRWEEVLALYRTEVEQGIQASRKSSLLYKMGEVYQERLGEEELALQAYAQALKATPSFLPALQALARLHRKREAWEELIVTLQRQVEVLSDPERRAATLHSIGELYEGQLSDPEQAVACYREAMEQFPGYEASLNALLRQLERTDSWREVVEVYDWALSSATDNDAKVALLKRAGEVWDGRLLDPERAIACYEEALALDERDLECLEAMSKLGRRTKDYPRLVETFEQLAVCSTDTAEAVGYLYEAASVMEVHLPDHDPTPIYERIVQTSNKEISAIEALGRRYDGGEDLEGMLRTCDAHKSLEDDPESRGTLLLQLAGFCEASGDASGAAWALGEAAAISEDWIVERELRRMREQLGQWEGVAESLEREAQLCRSSSLAVASLMSAANLHQQRFSDQEREAAALAKVLELDPFHEEAAGRLEQLLVQREAWQELVEVLRRRLDVIAAGARPASGSVVQAQIELLARMAWIQREHLRRPLEAVATLNRSLQLDPNHLPTLMTLGELHMGLEQWKEAVDISSRIIAVSSDPELLRLAHFRLGDVWSEKLGDQRRAISSYQNVLALAAADPTALSKLYELFLQGRDWENAADTVSRLIEVESDPARLVAHHTALAEIQEQGFGDPRMAANQLQQALAIDATSEEVLDGLVRLYTQLGDWEALSDSIRSTLVALPGDQEILGIPHRLRLGEILRRRLMRSGEALEQYRAVVEIDPTNIAARLATASILVEEGRLDEAIIEHREIQGIDPLHGESLAQMRTILSRMGNHEIAYAIAAVLVCLETASEAEENFYRERRARGVRYPQAASDPSVFESVIMHPDEDAAGRRVLAVLGEAAHRIRPPRLADWRVAKADRLPFRTDDPLRALTREVGLVLGLDRDIEIYISPTRSREMELLLTDPPALVVGGGVMGAFSSMEVRFWLAQLLSYIRNHTWVAYGYSHAELRMLVHAACRVTDSTVMFTGDKEMELAETTRLVQRSLSRRGRRALEEVCMEYLSGQEPSYRSWARAMQHTALHTGLWVVNDLETAMGHLRRVEPDLSRLDEGADLGLLVQRSPLATELVQYWISEEFDSLRRA
jgi:tetratricopeptide (TPR) repeat protein